MSLDGHLNAWDGNTLQGWAFDRAVPDAPVEVDVELSNGFRTTTTANIFREDLLRNGVGNGHHGFAVRLPALSADENATLSISARIKDTDCLLKGSPLSIPASLPFSLIAGDIVNNCNLRCPFCLVDYSLIKGLKLMPEETFLKALELAPLVPDGAYWLSCLHEPTLHPHLMDFIELVPQSLRKKFSFTTNFCKKLDDSALERLAKSGIHSVRVSFDSMEPERFKMLRKGGRYEVFEDNLRRFTSFLRSSSQPPLLHLISMALRDNLQELPEMVRLGAELHGAAIHEVRFMYYLPHIADWGREHMLKLDQWNTLEQTLRALNLKSQLLLCGPEAGMLEKFDHDDHLKEYFPMEAPFGGTEDPLSVPLLQPEDAGRLAPDEAFRLRLRWDGMTMIEQIPEIQHRAFLPRIPEPATYFRRMRLAAAKQGPSS